MVTFSFVAASLQPNIWIIPVSSSDVPYLILMFTFGQDKEDNLSEEVSFKIEDKLKLKM